MNRLQTDLWQAFCRYFICFYRGRCLTVHDQPLYSITSFMACSITQLFANSFPVASGVCCNLDSISLLLLLASTLPSNVEFQNQSSLPTILGSRYVPEIWIRMISRMRNWSKEWVESDLGIFHNTVAIFSCKPSTSTQHCSSYTLLGLTWHRSYHQLHPV